MAGSVDNPGDTFEQNTAHRFNEVWQASSTEIGNDPTLQKPSTGERDKGAKQSKVALQCLCHMRQ